MNEPTPPKQRRRRVNPDKAPFDQLPIITADTINGPVRVVRGTLDLTELRDNQLAEVRSSYGHTHHYVVITNTFGQHRVVRSGQLVPRDLDLTRIGKMPHREEINFLLGHRFHPHDLPHMVFELRHHAERFTQLAEAYEALVADGWELNTDPDTSPWGDIIAPNADADTAAGSDVDEQP
jgi:hypothetical protein